MAEPPASKRGLPRPRPQGTSPDVGPNGGSRRRASVPPPPPPPRAGPPPPPPAASSSSQRRRPENSGTRPTRRSSSRDSAADSSATSSASSSSSGRLSASASQSSSRKPIVPSERRLPPPPSALDKLSAPGDVDPLPAPSEPSEPSDASLDAQPPPVPSAPPQMPLPAGLHQEGSRQRDFRDPSGPRRVIRPTGAHPVLHGITPPANLAPSDSSTRTRTLSDTDALIASVAGELTGGDEQDEAGLLGTASPTATAAGGGRDIDGSAHDDVPASRSRLALALVGAAAAAFVVGAGMILWGGEEQESMAVAEPSLVSDRVVDGAGADDRAPRKLGPPPPSATPTSEADEPPVDEPHHANETGATTPPAANATGAVTTEATPGDTTAHPPSDHSDDTVVATARPQRPAPSSPSRRPPAARPDPAPKQKPKPTAPEAPATPPPKTPSPPAANVPLAPSDPRALLQAAKKANKGGRPDEGYRLASASYRQTKSSDAAEVMVHAACMQRNRSRAEAALQNVRLLRRLHVKSKCRAVGMNL